MYCLSYSICFVYLKKKTLATNAISQFHLKNWRNVVLHWNVHIYVFFEQHLKFSKKLLCYLISWSHLVNSQVILLFSINELGTWLAKMSWSRHSEFHFKCVYFTFINAHLIILFLYLDKLIFWGCFLHYVICFTWLVKKDSINDFWWTI